MTSPPATPSHVEGDDPRRARLLDWLAPLASRYALDPGSMRPASNDASFRRYFRLDSADPAIGSLIAMDAPPPMEDCGPFLHAAAQLAAAGVSVPAVFAQDLAQGFLLLGDLGHTTYLDEIAALAGGGGGPRSVHQLYLDAIDTLVRMQVASRDGVFPLYDRELLLRELNLYPDWYVARHKAVRLDDAERAALQGVFETILANNLAQPRVFVHRDYHSRNLMVVPGPGNPGVLDFQDAVHGPITYDLVSLLRDAYIRWPEEQVIDWTVRYWERARAAGLPVPAAFDDFWRDFEFMGLQRHIKVLGIFARLFHRDGKDRYLADMPVVFDYVIATVRRYRAFDPLRALIDRIEDTRPGAGAGR